MKTENISFMVLVRNFFEDINIHIMCVQKFFSQIKYVNSA